ncbi:hypothetical protein [Burkholderia cenocepacia]|uniref:hypothetical protein n=1 Tax=Burkholderia cenocepacia TaxID=95486 RepID=UPI000F593015|nr:hypothetical protein [Burkholderia cenocepacia]
MTYRNPLQQSLVLIWIRVLCSDFALENGAARGPGLTNIDVFSANGNLVAVGNREKANNLEGLRQGSRICQVIAGQRRISAEGCVAESASQSAINVEIEILDA